METQNIVNLLNDSDNESSYFATRKWYVINDQKMESTVKEMKMIQPLSFRQKLLYHLCVITQMLMCLWQEI